MNESAAALKGFILAELGFKHHLEAIYAHVIQPLKSDFQVCHKIHPKSTLAGLLEISYCRRSLHSCLKQISEHIDPETFESDSELCMRQYAEYVEILSHAIKHWSLVGLPDFFTVWSRQRTNPAIRQALIDIGDTNASWRLISQLEINWISNDNRLDIFSTCLLPFYFVANLVLKLDQLRNHLQAGTETAQLALIARNKMEALDRWIEQQSNTKEQIRQIRILAIEYLIYDCPILLDRSRTFKKAALFQLTTGFEAGPPEKVILLAFSDILIWADSESKSFLGGVYRANYKVSEDPLNQLTICLQINSAETVVKFQSLETQQHEEWSRYLNTENNSMNPIELPRRHSLLNKYPPQTLPVEVRVRSKSDNSIAITDEILVHDGDHPSKLAYMFARRHQLPRLLINELCCRLHSVAASRCEDIKARRRLYLGRHQQ